MAGAGGEPSDAQERDDCLCFRVSMSSSQAFVGNRDDSGMRLGFDPSLELSYAMMTRITIMS